MSYTDAEMMLVTQIAYLDVDLSDRSGKKNVGDVVEAVLKKYGTYDAATGTYVAKADLKDGVAKAQFETAQNIMELAEKNNVVSWRNWEVVDVCNNNDKSGFYGCMIDTGGGDAIIACRGSESSSTQQTILDWGLADAGRLNNPETIQQSDATAYMARLYEKYGDKYDKFSITGHSLGGSLAMHSAFSAPPEMQDKIDKVISFDGPGFSDEYLAVHKDGINRIKDKVYHYEYSFVGALLTQPKGIHNRVIKAHNDKEVSNIFKTHLFRHHTRNIEFDQNGNVIDGERDFLQTTWGNITKRMDNGNSFVTTMLFFKFYAFAIFEMYLASVYINGIQEMSQIVAKIQNKANELYQNFISLLVSGEYTINVSSIGSIADNLAGVTQTFERISGEIAEISRTLPYDSVSAYYYKHRLRTLSVQLVLEGRKASKMSSVVDQAAGRYNNGDQKVTGLF